MNIARITPVSVACTPDLSMDTPNDDADHAVDAARGHAVAVQQVEHGDAGAGDRERGQEHLQRHGHAEARQRQDAECEGDGAEAR